jgi:hypothetical protein
MCVYVYTYNQLYNLMKKGRKEGDAGKEKREGKVKGEGK